MLTGRESLIRLVGKRRHFLPNRESLFSSPHPSPFPPVGHPLESCLNSVSNDKDAEDGLDGGAVPDEVLKEERVTCPVCGNQIRGEDYLVNSHLDICLGRGTKRKLAQRTLLQLNFTRLPKIQVYSDESEPSIPNIYHSCSPGSNVIKYELQGLNNFVKAEKSGCELAVSNGSAETLIGDNKSDTLSVSSKDLAYSREDVQVEDFSGVVLESYIVGCKFSDQKELLLGTEVILLREPDNAKDPNAVKVLSTSSGCFLGYLPRQLAQYVSPLLGKCCINFEGHITSVPEHDLDVVPIQISCPKMIDHVGIKDDDLKEIGHLLREAVTAANAAKRNPPSLAKYQKNFHVLVNEVLNSSSHLFTDNEKLFIDMFKSLSDDSQRLFIRLYTRKGPWFRLSSLSYPEIPNVQQAVRDLSATGFTVALESSGVNSYDMMGVLNTLSVSELYEILCVLKKNGNRGLRKKDIIASLLSLHEDGLSPLLPNMILERAGLCVRISSKAESLFWRAQRLFFLNGEQDLSSFLLVDLGILKYPSYHCIINDQIFVDRAELLAYEEAIEVAQLMDESLEENDNDKILRCIDVANS